MARSAAARPPESVVASGTSDRDVSGVRGVLADTAMIFIRFVGR
jgi:hypothetical protein